MSAGCAEMRKPRKIGGFIHFGETGDEPNTFYFYFLHNIGPKNLNLWGHDSRKRNEVKRPDRIIPCPVTPRRSCMSILGMPSPLEMKIASKITPITIIMSQNCFAGKSF